MTACIAPPPLEDADLLMIVDAVAPSAMRDHVARCPACAARAESLAQQQMALRAQLDRATCPPSVELGDYRLGLLAAPAAARVAAHLAVCPRCSAELAGLDTFLAITAPALEPGALDRIAAGVRVLTARLVSGLEGLTSTPAYAAVRGETGGPLVYEAEGWQITLEASPDVAEPARRTLLGLVTGPVTGAGVTLLREGAAVASAPVDAAGNFMLEGLLPGQYVLALDLAAEGVEIQVAPLLV